METTYIVRSFNFKNVSILLEYIVITEKDEHTEIY